MKILFTLSILLALHNQSTAHDKQKNPAYKTLDPRKGNEPKPLDQSKHAPKRIGSYDLVPSADTSSSSPQTSQKTFATQTTLKDTPEETTYERIPALKPTEPLYIPATSSAEESETFKNKKPSVAAVTSVAAARKRTSSISQQSASYPSLPQSHAQPIATPYPPYNPQQASSYPPQQPYYPCHGYPSAPDIPSYQPGYQPIPYSVAQYPQNYPAYPILQQQPIIYPEQSASGSFSRRSSSNSFSSERQQSSGHRRQRSSSDPNLAVSIGALSLDEQSADPLQRLAAKKEDAVRTTLEQLKKQLQIIQERITDINARDYADAPHKKSVLQKIGLSKTDLEQQQKNRDTEIARLQQEKIKIVEKIEKIQTTLTK